MTSSPASMVIEAYRDTHRRILEFAENLSEEQITWTVGPGRLSIAFFLWHLARWAEHLQSALPGMTPELSRRLPPREQVWESRGLARVWGLHPGTMGYADTGMYMDEETAARMKFPSKDVLLDYLRLAFAAADAAVRAVDDEQFLTEEQPQPMTEGIWKPGGTVGRAIFAHHQHDLLHFGMMMAILGQQGGGE